MKNQLLEDIGENHSLPIIVPEHTAAAPASDKWHAGQWRQRETAAAEPCAAPEFSEPLAAPAFAEPLAAPEFAEPLAAPAFSEPLAAPAFSEPLAAPAFSEPLVAPAFAEPLAVPKFAKPLFAPAFSEPLAAPPFPEPPRPRPPPTPPPPPPQPPLHALDPDPLAEYWASANPATEPRWFERWGRRAATWGAGVAALVLVAGAAAWIYEETRTEQALAVASSALETPALARVARAPVEPIDVQASELAPLAMDFQAEIPDFSPTPVAKKPVRSRVRAAAMAPRRAAQPPAPDPARARESKLAETLRQCRAAGYHAEQCVKRGCVATPYGIACKG